MAAGSGRRFGGHKQFLRLAGSSVAGRSVATAKSFSEGVVLVVPSDAPSDGPDAETECGADAVVRGGATRGDSVRAGLAAVPDDASVIVVHDAARPLARPSLFAAVITAVRETGGGGAVPVVPVTDTLKRVASGEVIATVDREGLVSVQTPQAFDADALRRAHQGADQATDDAGLVERLGLSVVTVPGDPRNLKLTHQGDLELAEALLAQEGG